MYLIISAEREESYSLNIMNLLMKKRDTLDLYSGVNKAHFHVKRKYLQSPGTVPSGIGGVTVRTIKGAKYSLQGLINNNDD